ncbi:MAG: hydrogenase maturation peptidase HycI [Candidatus Freyarchaeota archaeon]
MTYEELENKLKKFLNKPKKVALIGVGSEFRGDDYVGMEICKRLKSKIPSKVAIIESGTSPENFTGKLRRIKPSHIIIIDAADMDAEPGTIRIIDSSNIDGLSISTHRIPLSLFINYLKKNIDVSITFIGIQPKSTGFGEPLSPELEKAVVDLSKVLKKVLHEV